MLDALWTIVYMSTIVYLFDSRYKQKQELTARIRWLEKKMELNGALLVARHETNRRAEPADRETPPAENFTHNPDDLGIRATVGTQYETNHRTRGFR